jgi:hypothetical protein
MWFSAAAHTDAAVAGVWADGGRRYRTTLPTPLRRASLLRDIYGPQPKTKRTCPPHRSPNSDPCSESLAHPAESSGPTNTKR